MKSKIIPKKNSFFFRNRFFLGFIIYLLLYHTILVNRLQVWELNDLTHSVYCVDYSFGFASKLLPGAICRLILGTHPSKGAITVYATAVIIIFFILLSAILQKFMNRIPAKYRNSAFILVLFFLSGAYTFSIYTKWVGLADTYWLFIALAFFVFLEHNKLYCLIPLLFIFSLLIHFSALVFVIPLFSMLLLYKVSVVKKKRKKHHLLLVFAFSIVLTLASFSILMLNESKMICSVDEFHQKLSENGTNYYFYHDYSFFHNWGGREFVPDSVLSMKPSLSKFFNLFYYQVKLVYDLLQADSQKMGIALTIGGLLILTPLVCLFIKFHYYRFRADKNRLKRFTALLMIMQFPFIVFLGFLFAISVDITRYYTHAFLVMFTCVLYVLYTEPEMQIIFFEKMKDFKQSLPAKLYFLAYVVTTFAPSL